MTEINNNRAPRASDLATIDAPIGTPIWVEEEQGFRVAVPGSSALGRDQSGPLDQTRVAWRRDERPIPHVYGNRDVCRRIVDSRAAEKKVQLVHLGDSRATPSNSNGSVRLYETYGWGVPWGGFNTIPGALDPSQPWTNTVYNAVTTPVATPIGTYLANLSPMWMQETAFENGTADGGSLGRFQGVALFAGATQIVLKEQLVGHAFRCHTFWRNGPFGVTTADVELYMRGAWGVLTEPKTKISTYAASEETVIYTLNGPSSWDFVAQPDLAVDFGYTAGGTTRAGEYAYSLGVVFESEIGVTHHCLAIGGRTTDNFLDDDVFNPTVAYQQIASLSGEKILWISLGTNGGGTGTAGTATLLAKFQQLISDFRAVFPDAYVLIDTAYESSTEGLLDPARVTAALELARTDPLVCVIDTQSAMPPYLIASHENLMIADGVHYNDPGKIDYIRMISNLIYRAGTS